MMKSRLLSVISPHENQENGIRISGILLFKNWFLEAILTSIILAKCGIFLKRLNAMTEIDRDQQTIFREITHSEDTPPESLEIAFDNVNASVDQCKAGLDDLMGRINNRLSTKKISQKLVTIVVGVLLFQTSLIYVLFRLMLK